MKNLRGFIETSVSLGGRKRVSNDKEKRKVGSFRH